MRNKIRLKSFSVLLSDDNFSPDGLFIVNEVIIQPGFKTVPGEIKVFNLKRPGLDSLLSSNVVIFRRTDRTPRR